MTKQQPKLHRDQDPGTTQPEGDSTYLNYKFFFFFLDIQIFPVLAVNSLCKNIFLIFFSKFPVFSLSGKMDFQIPCFPCFPCAVATLLIIQNHFGHVPNEPKIKKLKTLPRHYSRALERQFQTCIHHLLCELTRRRQTKHRAMMR